MAESPLASSEWAGFVTAMRFSPDDLTHRLIAADWLQDTNRPELIAWADFVRYHCDAAAPRPHVYTDACDCRPCRGERRATALWDRWSADWLRHAFGHVYDLALQGHTPKDWRLGMPNALAARPYIERGPYCPDGLPGMFERVPVTRMLTWFQTSGNVRGLELVRWWLDVSAQPNEFTHGPEGLVENVSASLSMHAPTGVMLGSPVTAMMVTTPGHRSDAIAGVVHRVIKDRAVCLARHALPAEAAR